MSGRRGKSDWPTVRGWYYGMPRPIRVMAWWWLIPFAAQGIWLLLLWVGPNWAWLTWLKHSPLNGCVMFVPLYVVIGIMAVRTRCIRREYRESEGRMCTHCMQSLAGLQDAGTCPECGEAYEVEKDRAVWKKAGMEWRGR